jgi:hypothetical protein
MEHRQDLERLLLDGLPDLERQHAVEAMDRTTAAKLRRKRASGSAISSHDEDGTAIVR